ncbi:16S rRNA (adenine(1518)-N(6)/adenine(1519)-N(6))-dimethyltransferase RsmA [Bacteroidota bacterium]
MYNIKPKKYLGQHFLKDHNIARKIAASLTGHTGYHTVIEIGPGTGVLTRYLIEQDFDFWFIEIDNESVSYLQKTYPQISSHIIKDDFLKLLLEKHFKEKFAVIGNFPYNISSQIFFKILDYRHQIPEVVGMVQKEVAERLAANPGNKTYGKLTVLLKTYYDIEYLFTVEPHVFHPQPKVRSGVIRLKRNNTKQIPCDEQFYFQMVKQSFQNRRKTLRNALKAINLPEEIRSDPLLDKRAEQLDVSNFVELCQKIKKHWTR